MRNHHLLIRTKEANLSRTIQWLGVSYSVWFNRRHQRSGHLFQGRFKSFLIENDRYFTAMCLYIHGNPLRAGIVSTYYINWGFMRTRRLGRYLGRYTAVTGAVKRGWDHLNSDG
ncbi:MAG: transposase [Thermodesulfobacteriota bacterium]